MTQPAQTPERTRARKAAERQRRREAGLVAVTVYTYPECRDAVRRAAEKLTQAAALDRKDQ